MPATQVLHIASHHINIGDGALIFGIRRHLAEIADEPIQYSDYDVVDLRPHDQSPAEVIAAGRHDLVLVGGGGTIDGKPNRLTSGMALDLSADQLQRLNPPLAYVALGHNLFPNEPFHCQDALATLLQTCTDLDIPFSVRNDGSLERLQQAVGADADNVIEVPDPGFFITSPASAPVSRSGEGRRTVILQIAGDNIERRIHQLKKRENRLRLRRKSHSALHQFLDEMAGFAGWLVQTFDVDVVVAPHITRDLTIVAQVLERIPPAIARYHVRTLGILHGSQAPEFFAAYAAADLVVGMRGHSVICAVGLGVPCVALSTHDKVAGFMKKCGLQQWTTSASPNMVQSLRDLCTDLLNSPQHYHAARTQGTADFYPRFSSFMKSCWNRRRG